VVLFAEFSTVASLVWHWEGHTSC